MKLSTKFIVLTLLIAFFGLFSLGLVVDQATAQTQHSSGIDPVRSNPVQQDTNSHTKQTSNGVDCFGAGCGPVEHVVMHDYLVTDEADRGNKNEFYYQSFLEFEDSPQTPEILIESPPPEFSLV